MKSRLSRLQQSKEEEEVKRQTLFKKKWFVLVFQSIKLQIHMYV